MKPTKFGMGQGIKRVEDVRLITGAGRYASDASDQAALRAVFVRSPYGHARFKIGDLAAARAMPGVKGIFVAGDFAELGGLPCLAPVPNSDGTQTPLKPFPVMSADEVQHVGDIVAMVVADTVAEARDAAEVADDRLGGASRRGRRRTGDPTGRASGFAGAPGMSPTTPTSATKPRQTRLLPRRRMSRGSRSSIPA